METDIRLLCNHDLVRWAKLTRARFALKCCACDTMLIMTRSAPLNFAPFTLDTETLEQKLLNSII